MTATHSTATPSLDRPHSFRLDARRTIDAPIEHVFRFLTHEIPHCYTLLSRGHERFDVEGGGPLVLGSVVDCRETTANQEVRHRYRVVAFDAPRRLHMASTPSTTFVHLPDRTIEGASETLVRYELAPREDGRTSLAMTIVIALDSVWTKVLASLSGTRRLWGEHQQGELDRLVTLVEATSPGRARRLTWAEAQ